MAYAEKTSISVSRTKADIEDLVQKHGADQFVSGYKGGCCSDWFFDGRAAGTISVAASKQGCSRILVYARTWAA